MTSHPTKPAESSFDPGSFRDRHGRVFYRDDDVLRYIDSEALQEWRALETTRFFPCMIREGRIIGTELLPETAPEGWSGVLRHERIPFVSYPYEWPFSMLKDAALLQLDLLQASLQEGFILKDSSAFNFQWKGVRPVLIDVLSLQKLAAGEVWTGYRQFCQMFLYPLMLQAYRHVPFQARLRGDIDGISPGEMNRLLSMRDRFRAGVFTHVYLQSKFQEGMGKSTRDVKSELKQAGFQRDMVLANIRGLEKLVRKLEWKPDRSEWSDYKATTSYSPEEALAKDAFVRSAIETRKWNLAWDLGCNTGWFSRIASAQAQYVVAMDADALVIEKLHASLKQEGCTNILPLIMNVADASPSLGWKGRERKAIGERGTPDLILGLALMHHLVISANIPVADLVDWLTGFGASMILEFVTREDPMVRKLLLNKEDQYTDYHVEYFEKCLSSRCRIVRREPIGARILYHTEPM